MGVKKKVKICQNNFLDTTCSVQLVIVWQNQGKCGKNQATCDIYATGVRGCRTPFYAIITSL